MKTLCLLCLMGVAALGADYRLTVQNHTSSNLLVGGLTVSSGRQNSFRLPESFGPFQVNFGGTNYEFALESDRTILFGENLLIVREEWTPLQYFWLGFTTAAGFSLSGWGLTFLRKLSRQSVEL